MVGEFSDNLKDARGIHSSPPHTLPVTEMEATSVVWDYRSGERHRKERSRFVLHRMGIPSLRPADHGTNSTCLQGTLQPRALRMFPVCCDVRDDQFRRRGMGGNPSPCGRVDVLVNNAGVNDLHTVCHVCRQGLRCYSRNEFTRSISLYAKGFTGHA